MPLSIDVNLPRNHDAQFPTRCVQCDLSTNGNTIRVRTHTIGLLTSILMVFGKVFTVHVPCCQRCTAQIRKRKIYSLVASIAVAGLVMTFVWPQVANFAPEPLRKWVAAGLILVALLPLFILSILRPPAFDMTAYGDSVDYEFRRAEYASSFAQLNDDAEWVKLE